MIIHRDERVWWWALTAEVAVFAVFAGWAWWRWAAGFPAPSSALAAGAAAWIILFSYQCVGLAATIRDRLERERVALPAEPRRVVAWRDPHWQDAIDTTARTAVERPARALPGGRR